MHNEHQKCIEKNMRAKKDVQSTAQTTWHSQKEISHDKKGFFKHRQGFFVVS